MCKENGIIKITLDEDQQSRLKKALALREDLKHTDSHSDEWEQLTYQLQELREEISFDLEFEYKQLPF